MTAFKLLKQHGSIEAVAATLDSCKLPPAESWQVSASLAPLRLSRASAPLCAASPPLHLSASPPLHLSAAAPPRLSAPLHRLHPRRLCTPSSPHRLITQSFHRLLRLARRAPSSCSPRWWTWRASSCAGARPMCPGCAPSSCSDTPLTRRAPPRLSPPPLSTPWHPLAPLGTPCFLLHPPRPCTAPTPQARVAKIIERLNKCSASGKQTRLVRPPAADPAFTFVWAGWRVSGVGWGGC